MHGRMPLSTFAFKMCKLHYLLGQETMLLLLLRPEKSLGCILPGHSGKFAEINLLLTRHFWRNRIVCFGSLLYFKVLVGNIVTFAKLFCNFLWNI